MEKYIPTTLENEIEKLKKCLSEDYSEEQRKAIESSHPLNVLYRWDAFQVDEKDIPLFVDMRIKAKEELERIYGFDVLEGNQLADALTLLEQFKDEADHNGAIVRVYIEENTFPKLYIADALFSERMKNNIYRWLIAFMDTTVADSETQYFDVSLGDNLTPIITNHREGNITRNSFAKYFEEGE